MTPALGSLEEEELREAALPFSGRWVEIPAPRRLPPIVRQLLAAGLVVEAWQYVESQGALLVRDPELPGLLLALGDALMTEGRPTEGMLAFHRAAQVAPDSSQTHFTLGQALLFRGDARQAAEHLRKAAALDPEHAAARQQLAWILTTTRDQTLQDRPAALRWAEEAVRLTEERDAEMLDTLAIAHAGLRQFDKALEFERKALEVLGPQAAPGV